MDSIYENLKKTLEELLENFENIQTLRFQFYHIPRAPYTDLSEMVLLFNMEKTAEIYQLRHVHNCLQFLRKNRFEC